MSTGPDSVHTTAPNRPEGRREVFIVTSQARIDQLDTISSPPSSGQASGQYFGQVHTSLVRVGTQAKKQGSLDHLTTFLAQPPNIPQKWKRDFFGNFPKRWKVSRVGLV